MSQVRGKVPTLVLSVSGGVSVQLKYSLELVTALIKYDIGEKRYAPEKLAAARAIKTGIARQLPVIREDLLAYVRCL